MRAPKEKRKKLVQIPWHAFEDLEYTEMIEAYKEEFGDYVRDGCTVLQSVHRELLEAELDVSESGLEKAIIIIAAMLFEMEHNAVEPEIAYEAYRDIQDLLTGEYDHLMAEQDRKDLHEDITTILTYLNLHPELKEGEDIEIRDKLHFYDSYQ
ncbi:MAG: hypothetical protein ACK5L3_11845 [Oscillospiraceae bacterium]